MKFIFSHIILISSCLCLNWVSPYDVPSIPEPSHQLSYLYSKHHNQLPKSDDPNTSSQELEIPVATIVMNDPLAFLPTHSNLLTEDTQHAHEYGLYLLLLSEYVHSQNHIFELEYPYNVFVHLLSILHIDIWSPIQYDNLVWLLNANSSYNLTLNKTKKFIETESICNEIAGF